jgi:chloramphenicol-sensitive protein RarD
MDRQPTRTAPGALAAALGAQLVWGLIPLYLVLVKAVPAIEFVGWRIIVTIPFCLLIIQLRRQWPELAAAFRQWRVLRLLLLSAVLIAANWLIYIAAIQAGHVYAASFGYYIAPLMQVLAGTLLLGERLSPRQWLAVAVSACGVALLGWGELSMLAISLALAFSWSSYGFVRKFAAVGSLPGLTVETLVLLPGGMAIAAWFAATPVGSSFGQEAGLSALIVFAGPLTALPLVLFAIAARRMDFTTLGMLQFASPTVVFILGVTVFGLPLDPVQVASFVVIWAAIGLYVWDMLARRRSASEAPA